MKNLSFFVLALLFSLPVFSQDSPCESGYMPFKEGVLLEMTNYDHKGKVASTQRQKVASLEEIDGGFEATLEFEVFDKKGKSMTEGSFGIKCQGESIYMDLSNMIDPRSMAGLEGMEMEIKNEAIEVPNNPRPGQTLPDGKMEMKARTNGMSVFSMTVRIENRKVEAIEEVTTPAGTFECVKITQETVMESIFTQRTTSATWYAKGVGTVKTENYDRGGDVESSMVLTKLER